MKHATVAERMRYRMDNVFSKGPGALIAGLAGLSGVIIVITGAILAASGIAPEGSEAMGFWEASWEGMMRIFDAGTLGGDTGWAFRLVMLVVTIGGVFIFSSLIGILTTGLDARLERLRKGRSKVIESGHTIILGWNGEIIPIIQELVTANENKGNACVVVLSEKDKIEMEDEIHERVGNCKTTKIVCRTGNPFNSSDLEIAGIEDARSLIVLSGNSENPDMATIKTLLAVTKKIDDFRPDLAMVAEIHEARNMQPAEIAGRGRVQVISVGSLLARIMAQACRQSGLSVVYAELLDFSGDEMYFKDEPSLLGEKFGDILFRYETSTVIGLVTAEGVPVLKPPFETVLSGGMKIIAISEDDDTVILSDLERPSVVETAIVSDTNEDPGNPERTVIIGWNRRASAVITELDHYVVQGSSVTVLGLESGADNDFSVLKEILTNQSFVFTAGDSTDREAIESLSLGTASHVIILSEWESFGIEEADSRTLVTLLHLRDIAEKNGYSFSITSEILDIRNRELAEIAEADDFIVSDRLVSLLAAQVSENPALNTLFAELFTTDGSEIYMRPVSGYVKDGVPVDFYTIMDSAIRHGELAIGYRIAAHAHDSSKAFGVTINPVKSEIISFHPEDRIIVLAED